MKFSKENLHNFTAVTAKRWGLRTRVTLNNKTREEAYVNAVIRSEKGSCLAQVKDFARIPNGGAAHFELHWLAEVSGLAERLGRNEEEWVFVFSIIPVTFLEQSDPIEIEKKEIFRLNGAQDHYVEYYDEDSGFSSGVLYQVAPMNDVSFSPGGSLILQAPKVFLSESENTIFQLHFFSTDSKCDRKATVHCALYRENGEEALRWTEEVPSHGMSRIDVKEAFSRHGASWENVASNSGFLFFQAHCFDSSMVVFTFNRNEKTGSFAVEHSLPPIYYNSLITGAQRQQILSFWQSRMESLA